MYQTCGPILCQKLSNVFHMQNVQCHRMSGVAGVDTREVAYTYAIRSAAVAYAVTQACSLGNIIGCGCDKSKGTDSPPLANVVGVRPSVGARWRDNGIRTVGGDDARSTATSVASVFRWGGCSADVRYGLRFSRVFLDARELQESSRSLVNLHNNRAGRKVVHCTVPRTK